MSTMSNDLIRGYYNLPMREGSFTYDELAEHYAYFDRDAIRFFLARSDKRLFGGRFWVESKQFESIDGERDPRTYSVAWVSEYNGNLSIEKWGEFDNLPAARGWAKRFAEAVSADTDDE